MTAILALLGMVVASAACVDERAAQAQKAKQSSEEKQDTRKAIERDEPLPEQAHVLLTQRMFRHGDDMELLLWASVTLDYEAARISAERMAKEPRIKRPTPGPLDPLTAVLPPRYFDLQDEFYAAAIDVFRASEKKDPEALADSYGELAGTCIRCHAVYLRFEIPE